MFETHLTYKAIVHIRFFCHTNLVIAVTQILNARSARGPLEVRVDRFSGMFTRVKNYVKNHSVDDFVDNLTHN